MANRLRNLSSHLDTHTQAKRAACPTCGLLLVDFRKLEDHLKRQQIHLLNKSTNVSAFVLYICWFINEFSKAKTNIAK